MRKDSQVTEIPVKQVSIQAAAVSACSKSNFGYILAQSSLLEGEMVGRNFYGNRKRCVSCLHEDAMLLGMG